MNPVIRAVTPDEWQRWRELRLLALRESAAAFCSRYDEWADADEARWRQRLSGDAINAMALDGEQPVGMVTGTWSNHGVELTSMYVAPAARRARVGEALIAAVTSWARQRGAPLLRLEVKPDNLGAIALYERLGFAHAGRSANGAELVMNRPL